MNEDIASISNERFAKMDADMIVGGFPCQDHSVARSLSGGMGIQGKKGVLFWEIIRATKTIKPKFLILENVDSLLKSPAKQRGRDFAIMLSSFNESGYTVEWRVINAKVNGWYRMLTPIECKRLNGFPDDWTHIMRIEGKFLENMGCINRYSNKKINIELLSEK